MIKQQMEPNVYLFKTSTFKKFPNLARFSIFTLIFLTFVSCRKQSETLSHVKASGNTVGNYKGIDRISKVLSSRISSTSKPFRLQNYTTPDLRAMLGTYTSNRGNVIFESGIPNPMNSMLWELIFNSVAEDISSLCLPDKTNRTPRANSSIESLNPEVYSNLERICAWPNPLAKNEALMMQIWFSVMGYDAPEAEFSAWKGYFLSSDSVFVNKSGQETLAAMLATILLNPYFLLEQ